MWANENHFVLAVIAAVVCNGWVLYVSFTAHISMVQARIAAANYRLRIASQFTEAVDEDEHDERNNIIERINQTEWDI